jgi:leucyl-tRNA synthetase
MHETYNFLYKHFEESKNSNDLIDYYRKILIIFSPVLPHLISECLSEIGYNDKNVWPEVEEKYLEKSEISFVIQINGKKRLLLNTEKDISESKLLDVVKKGKLLDKYLNNAKIIKIIFVKNRLMNILI